MEVGRCKTGVGGVGWGGGEDVGLYLVVGKIAADVEGASRLPCNHHANYKKAYPGSRIVPSIRWHRCCSSKGCAKLKLAWLLQ